MQSPGGAGLEVFLGQRSPICADDTAGRHCRLMHVQQRLRKLCNGRRAYSQCCRVATARAATPWRHAGWPACSASYSHRLGSTTKSASQHAHKLLVPSSWVPPELQRRQPSPQRTFVAYRALACIACGAPYESMEPKALNHAHELRLRASRQRGQAGGARTRQHWRLVWEHPACVLPSSRFLRHSLNYHK